jgi:hypothetical protein
MATYKFHALALTCLIANKEELGITEELAKSILLELSNEHSLEEWDTEWLTFSDSWVYFALKCINETQKTKLWDFVVCLTKYFENPSEYGMSPVVSTLLAELHSYI